MAKKSKTKSNSGFTKTENAVDVRKFINESFMGMSHEVLDALDRRVEQLEVEAEKALKEAPSYINDRYLQDDVVTPVEGGESDED